MTEKDAEKIVADFMEWEWCEVFSCYQDKEKALILPAPSLSIDNLKPAWIKLKVFGVQYNFKENKFTIFKTKKKSFCHNGKLEESALFATANLIQSLGW